MTKLEELKQFIAQQFENAESKDSIDALAKINSGFEAVEQEQAELEKKNAELIGSYKELVRHTSFKADAKSDIAKQSDPVGGQAPSLDSIIAQFVEK